MTDIMITTKYKRKLKSTIFKNGIAYCSCHDVEMIWHKDKRNKVNGGSWRCRIKHRSNQKNYTSSFSPEKHEQRIREFVGRMKEKEEDLLWRLKRNTLQWQRDRKRGKYI